MDKKQINKLSSFDKDIVELLKNQDTPVIAKLYKRYQEVIILGPTNAKVELYNLLQADHHFDNIKINIKQAQKMTEPEEHAFVRRYFTRRFLIPLSKKSINN